MLGTGQGKGVQLPVQRNKVDLHLGVVSRMQREEGYQGTLKEVPALTGRFFPFSLPPQAPRHPGN